MRKLLNKKILIILGIVIFLVVIVGGIFMATGGFAQPITFSLSVGAPAAAEGSVQVVVTPTPETVQLEPEKTNPASGIMVDLGAKVVNLADPGGYRYLRVGMVLEFIPPASYYLLKQEGAKKAEELKKEEQALRDEVTAFRPVIDDTVIGLISNKTFGDVFTLQGKEDLKEELRTTLNEKLEDLEVGRVYFTDFIVQ